MTNRELMQADKKVCKRCGKVNPAEIHTCSPQHSQCAECGKKSSDGWALYCVECLEPKQEPVAIVQQEAFGKGQVLWIKPTLDVLDGTLLYTAPPQREWIGLTPKDYDSMRPRVPYIVNDFTFADVAAIVEAKLKEKNT